MTTTKVTLPEGHHRNRQESFIDVSKLDKITYDEAIGRGMLFDSKRRHSSEVYIIPSSWTAYAIIGNPFTEYKTVAYECSCSPITQRGLVKFYRRGSFWYKLIVLAWLTSFLLIITW